MTAEITSGATPHDVVVRRGDVTYTAKLSMAAIVAAEKEYGQPINAIMEDVKASRMTAVVTMFWAMLRPHHATMTMEDAADAIDYLGLETTVKVFNECISRSSVVQSSGAPLARVRSRRGKAS